MRFISDNAASAHPAVMAAIVAANLADAAYDGDALSRRLNSAFSGVFEREVEVLWVSTGTAANALALSALCPPHGGVICHREAHINTDECGAPEFYTNGAKLLLADGEGAKLTPQGVCNAAAAIRQDVHQVQPHCLSITNATEYGLTYRPEEVAALGDIARDLGLRFHMDGARFANAIVSSGATPAELSWKAGVDALSFGFTKNGGLSAEALILFDPALAPLVRIRRKRAGHLLSKGRFLAAQLLAMIEDERWLSTARAANAGAAKLARAAASRLRHAVQANELFLAVSADEAKMLRAKGFEFYDWGEGAIRLVVSWDQPEAEIEALAQAIGTL